MRRMESEDYEKVKNIYALNTIFQIKELSKLTYSSVGTASYLIIFMLLIFDFLKWTRQLS